MLISLKKTIAVSGLAMLLAGSVSAEKNIILLIADGCGISHQTIARWFKGAPLAFDQLEPGLCMTNSCNSMITGSAAAATAIATGYKTWEQEGAVKCLGILPDSVVFPTPGKLPSDMQWKPVASVLEAARYCGKSTGLVVTSRISHATPAGFSSHWHDRDNESVIIEQQVYHNIDVVYGGGMSNLLPTSLKEGKRADGENLVDVLTSRGYNVITKRSELDSLPATAKKVWGLFNNSHMCPDINRPYFGKEEPSLAEMTKSAISILSRNQKGFFLMIEGSQIDFASHNNDAVGVVTEFMAFDSAVQVAIEFAKKNGNTTVMIFPDHDNGSISLGRRGDKYTDIQTEKVLPALKNARITSAGLLDTLIHSHKIAPVNFNFASAAVKNLMKIDAFTAEDSTDIKELVYSVSKGAKNDKDIAPVGRMIGRRASIGWTTYGHCGTNVWIYGLGVNFKSIIDNTDIAKICFKKMGITSDSLNKVLFQDAKVLFGTMKGVTISIDSTGTKNGQGTLTVTSQEKTAVFPFSKNEIWMKNGTKMEMNGITVYSEKSGKVYMPIQALKLFKKAGPDKVEIKLKS